jgi:phenylalanyl-tRNA synthetase beta chain
MVENVRRQKMKISLNSIRGMCQRYGCAGDPAPNGVDALVEKIGSQLGAIEEVLHIGDKYHGIIIAKVVTCDQHPNADRLHVCKIDDGGKVENVERDENGHVQVVCGAPNVREGLLVAWLPPGATVPESYYDIEPFVLSQRELRGVVSNGMLASPKELGLGDSHDGILEIEEEIAPGTDFAEQFGLKDDYVIDIENKMFTHRPDCFGMMGVAREIAGIQNQKFTSPEWYRADAALPKPINQNLRVEVRNEVPELTPRFVVLPMSGITIKPSPVWLQIELSRYGMRPINNIVDLTNYYMLLTGQPLHAYDYDKVKSQDEGADHATLIVRYPHESEKLKLLNGKEIEPRREAIMIASANKAIGLGGVMGGFDTEVDENTKNIILECASFDMYSIRRTSMAHGLFSDAVTRFNKGQSPLQNRAVLAKVVADIERLTDGKVAGDAVDDSHLSAEVLERGSLYPPVTTSEQFINGRLGLNLSTDEMKSLLENVEFKVEIDGDNLRVTAPFWRTDIEIPEDVVEEVGRLHGYDKLPLELPMRDITPAKKNSMLELETQIRDSLSRAGANEVLTYSFVHGNLLHKVGQDKNQAFKLSNALSPDLQYYRLSLTPSLLDKVHMNIKAGFDKFAIYELGVAHGKSETDDSGLPREFGRLGLVFAADTKAAHSYEGAPYYQALQYVRQLLPDTELRPLARAGFEDHVLFQQLLMPFDPHRAAVLFAGERPLGVVGEYRSTVRKNLKLPEFCAGFEIFLSAFADVSQTAYISLPKFPKVEQDICLKVTADMPYQELYDFVWKTLAEVIPQNSLPTLTPVDIYQRENDPAYKQITFRFTIASYEKTLTDKEVAAMLDHVAQKAHDAFNAERI